MLRKRQLASCTLPEFRFYSLLFFLFFLFLLFFSLFPLFPSIPLEPAPAKWEALIRCASRNWFPSCTTDCYSTARVRWALPAFISDAIAPFCRTCSIIPLAYTLANRSVYKQTINPASANASANNISCPPSYRLILQTVVLQTVSEHAL